jgi:endoglucanase
VRSRAARHAGWLAVLCTIATLGAAGCSGGPLAVHVAGNRLVDSKGHALRLLGVNRSGGEYACVTGIGFFAGPTDRLAIAAMASWHINVVRVPLNEQCWLGINATHPRYSGARYRRAVGRYVARLHRAGMYIVLDLHWNAPGRNVAVGQQPMADLDHAPAFWASVARRFKRDPAVIFDLYNEPRDISWTCWRDGCVLPQGWRTAGMQALLEAVRSTGAYQPVIASGLGSGNDLSQWMRYRPRDPAHQLVAGFHAYGQLGCATRSCWDAQLGAVARSTPVITTELGELDCSHVFTDQFMNWADSRSLSYLGWSWNPSGCKSPALIESWNGTPSAYGRGLRSHLLRLG